MTPIFQAVIPGRCIVKKNTKNLVGRGRFKRAVYSKRFVAWEKDALIVALGGVKRLMINEPVIAHFKFYFANRMAEADVSNLIEAPQDVLVKAGILKDDKLVMELWARKYFGHEPRVEITLFKDEVAA